MTTTHQHLTEMNRLLKGKTIKRIQLMTPQEAEEQGWDARTFVLVLNDETRIFASQDDEGNGPGALFGKLPDGKDIYVGWVVR